MTNPTWCPCVYWNQIGLLSLVFETRVKGQTIPLGWGAVAPELRFAGTRGGGHQVAGNRVGGR